MDTADSTVKETAPTGSGGNRAPLYTSKMIFALILPLIGEQFLNILVGMADTVMVSGVGEQAVSAVSLVDSLNILLITLFAALATGGAVITSQYIGKGDREAAGESAKQLTWFSVIFSSCIAALAIIFNAPLLRLIFGKVEPAVMANERTYFYITAASFPFLALYNADAALFRSVNKTRITLIISFLVNLMNIGGNALLIYGFKMGVAGAAFSTLAARAMGAVVSYVLLLHAKEQIHMVHPFRYKPDFGLLKKILHIGIPTGLESSLFQVGKLMLASLVSTFGTPSISGNAIGNSMASLSNIPGSAIGLGLVTIVGQCMGASQPDQAEKYTDRLLLMTFILMNLLDLALYIFAPQLAALYGLSDQSRDIAVWIMRSFTIAAIVFWPPAFTVPNVLRAAGDVRFTMTVAIGSMFIFRLGMAYFLAYTTDLGVKSCWIGMYTDWIVRAVLYFTRYKRGKWKKIRLV